jgi:Leucine-rich repeat (LRR) protein
MFLHKNSLTGNIPSTIGKLTELGSLYLSENQLIGAIPTEIGLLTQLEYLILSYNSVTGVIPNTICTGGIVVDCVQVTCGIGCCWCSADD